MPRVRAVMQQSDIIIDKPGDAQAKLSASQIEAFYHDEFAADQVRDFVALTEGAPPQGVVVDLGGGIGHFAHGLASESRLRVRVVDSDPVSVERCRQRGVEAVAGDALAPDFQGDEDAACFNLILHHLVGKDEPTTRALQIQALKAWQGHSRFVFVNEYIYESFVGHLSGRIIYAITSSHVLSAIGRAIGRVVPAFRANTFGTGVRFRASHEWHALFAEAGYAVKRATQGVPEHISPPLRLLLIKAIRRDSFRLEPQR